MFPEYNKKITPNKNIFWKDLNIIADDEFFMGEKLQQRHIYENRKTSFSLIMTFDI